MTNPNSILRLDHAMRAAAFRDDFSIDYYPDRVPASGVPHRHHHYQILWFPEAAGRHCIDDAGFEMKGNDLFLISDGQVHFYKEVSLLKGYVLMFKDVYWEHALKSIRAFKATLFNHLLISAHLHLSDEEGGEISHLMRHILAEQHSPDYADKAEVIHAYLKILLVRIHSMKGRAAHLSPLAGRNDYLLFQRFIALLENHYTDSHAVNFYADALGISGQKLAGVCRQYHGRNPKDLIDGRVIIAAKRQLQFESGAIKEIALSLGFSDQYQFSKFFKKMAGVSPAEYRSGK